MACRILNGPENYNPTQPGPRVFKPEPDTARPPMRLHCFPHTPVIVRSGVRSASAPPHEAGSQTYSSPHVNSDYSQQTIYLLQLARNVFYKKRNLRTLMALFSHFHASSWTQKRNKWATLGNRLKRGATDWSNDTPYHLLKSYPCLCSALCVKHTDRKQSGGKGVRKRNCKTQKRPCWDMQVTIVNLTKTELDVSNTDWLVIGCGRLYWKPSDFWCLANWSVYLYNNSVKNKWSFLAFHAPQNHIQYTLSALWLLWLHTFKTVIILPVISALSCSRGESQQQVRLGWLCITVNEKQCFTEKKTPWA